MSTDTTEFTSVFPTTSADIKPVCNQATTAFLNIRSSCVSPSPNVRRFIPYAMTVSLNKQINKY